MWAGWVFMDEEYVGGVGLHGRGVCGQGGSSWTRSMWARWAFMDEEYVGGVGLHRGRSR